jgi:para-aminobenzoate synthetase component I
MNKIEANWQAVPVTALLQEAGTFSLALRRFAQGRLEAADVGLFLDGSPCTLHPKLNEWVVLAEGAENTLTYRQNQLYFNDECLAAQGLNGLRQVLEITSKKTLSALPDALANAPWTSGWMGLLGYESAPLFEPALAPEGAWPLGFQKEESHPTAAWPELWWIQPKTVWLWHLPSQQAWVFTKNQTLETASQLWQEALTNAVQEIGLFSNYPSELKEKPSVEALLEAYTCSFSPQAYVQHTKRLQQHIKAGDIFQANLSLRLQKQVAQTSQQLVWPLYDALCLKNPSPFGGVAKTPYGYLVSNSPERLVRLTANKLADTRPIAGTRGRGQTAQQDLELGATLQRTPKEVAEHQMLVDLGRNDLGRVCKAGTLEVDENLVLERYSHVTHLVSNVKGELASQYDALDLLAALFPGGTITGCPKIRCIHLLAQAETVPRGFYTGSLGYLDWQRQRCDWNILIRSLSVSPVYEAGKKEPESLLRLHAGAGLVIDSVGEHEYKECLRKASALLETLQALENGMRLKHFEKG